MKSPSSTPTDSPIFFNESIVLGLSAVIVTVEESQPKVLIVRGAEHALSVGITDKTPDGEALPFGPFDPQNHATLEQGVRMWIENQTPLTVGYIEQLYTFGSKGRYAALQKETQRVISVGYLALTHQQDKDKSTEKVFFEDWYRYFPWEDWRTGKPAILNHRIEPLLKAWIDRAQDTVEKKERLWRAQLCFGLDGVSWDHEKVLERYELLYGARLVLESLRDRGSKDRTDIVDDGHSMLYDHRRILATAMGRLRGKLKYRPVVFELMPDEFTLLQLQKTVESLSGHSLHKQNFRRLVEGSGMVEEVKGKKSSASGGRPAALFRFRKNVIFERPAPGVRLSAMS